MSHVVTLLALSLFGADPDAAARPIDPPQTMTLHEAIRTGLKNSEFAKVETVNDGPDGKSLKIRPADPERSIATFKAEALDLARDVESGYWSISQQNAELWATETAVDLAEQALKREKAKMQVGHGNPVSLAEAEERVERFRHELTTAAQELMATETQFRHVLGLPEEGRRIVTTSVPLEAERMVDWQECLAAMLANEPEIVEGLREPKSVDREIVGTFQKKTQDLARYSLEVGANFKQFQTAKRLVSEALKGLEETRPRYESGKTAIGPYLDSVEDWSNAVRQEADFKARYNTSIASLERSQGTLLDSDGIALLTADPAQTEVIPPAADKADVAPPEKPAVQTVSFHLTVGSGPRPLEIQGSFTLSGSESPSP
jgi:hypothetical protein